MQPRVPAALLLLSLWSAAGCGRAAEGVDTPAAGGASTLRVRPATGGELEELGLLTGGALIVEVVPSGSSQDLKTGDVLVFAGGRPLADERALVTAVEAAAGSPLELLLYRDRVPVTVRPVLTLAMLGTTSLSAPPLGGRPPALVSGETASGETAPPIIPVTGNPHGGETPPPGAPAYEDPVLGVRLVAPSDFPLQPSKSGQFHGLTAVLYEFQSYAAGLNGVLRLRPGPPSIEEQIRWSEDSFQELAGVTAMTLEKEQPLARQPGTWFVREYKVVQHRTTFVNVHVHVLTDLDSFELVLNSNARGDGELLRAAMDKVIAGLSIAPASFEGARRTEGEVLGLRRADAQQLTDLGLQTGGALVIVSVPTRLAGSLRAGDVLVFGNGRPLLDLAALTATLEAAAGRPVELLYYRDQVPGTVAIEIGSELLPQRLADG